MSFSDSCVRCNHAALELLDHPECDCGCHVDMRAGLNTYLADGGTKERYIEMWKKRLAKAQALNNVMRSGLFG